MAIFPYGYRGPSRWRRIRRGAAALALSAALLVPGPGAPDAGEPARADTGAVRLTLKVARPLGNDNVKHEECYIIDVKSDSCMTLINLKIPYRLTTDAGSLTTPATTLVRPE